MLHLQSASKPKDLAFEHQNNKQESPFSPLTPFLAKSHHIEDDVNVNRLVKQKRDLQRKTSQTPVITGAGGETRTLKGVNPGGF